MDRGVVAEIESQLISEKRLNALKIQIIEVSPRRDYDFSEFFYHVKQGILKYHSGWRRNSQCHHEKQWHY